jgi:ferrous iron transport protein A
MPAPLSELRPGQVAEIVSIDCERPIARRLMEMGLLPGTSVRMVRVAPLRDPLELRLRDYSLSVRRSDAARISVLAREPA